MTNQTIQSPLRVAVLGAGFMGATHVRAFAAQPNVQVVGVSSRQADKAGALAQEVGARVWTDAHALLRDPNVDAVSITLPTHLHEEYASAALAAGKAVLLEKPMALTLEQCDAIIAAQQASGSLLMMAHTLRFWPEYEAMVALVHSGALGEPLSALAWRQTTHPDWSPWFANAELSGGAVLDLHIHDLDAMNWLFGTPKTVYARGQIGPSGGYDQSLTLLDYGRASCFVEGTSMMPRNYPFSMLFSVRCTRGVVEYTLRAGGEQVDSVSEGQDKLLVFEAGKEARTLERGIDIPEGDPYVREAAAFVDAVRSRVVPPNGAPALGRLAVQTALAARESLATGTVIHL